MFEQVYRPWGIDIRYTVRLSVGVEDAEDLIADLEQALRGTPGGPSPAGRL